MGFHQRRHRGRIGVPDVVAFLLVGVLVVLGSCWWRAVQGPVWAEALGRTATCEIRPTHFNAEPCGNKVMLTYEYEVGGVTFGGEWTGYWPRGHSPNALPDGHVEVLRTKDYPLTVLYDPEDPSRSRLHDAASGEQLLFTILTFASGICLTVYCVRVYPVWKSRQRRAFG